MNSIKSFFRLLFSFKGNIGRMDFFLGHFGGVLGFFIFNIILIAIFGMFAHSYGEEMAHKYILFSFALVWGGLSTLALSIKRLRDIGLKNTASYILSLLSFIPYTQLLILIPQLVMKGKNS